MKLFISYTTLDKEINKESLHKFSERIREHANVFVDLIDNNSENKQKRVLMELDESDFLVLLDSENIYRSKWVAIEIERATQKDIPIIRIPSEKLNNLTYSEILNEIEYNIWKPV